MTDNKDHAREWCLLSADDNGSFMLGDRRLSDITCGEMGAIFDLRTSSGQTSEVIIRIFIHTPFSSGKPREIIQISRYRQIAPKHGYSFAAREMVKPPHLKLNTAKTEELFGSEDARRKAKNRRDELILRRDNLSGELAAVKCELEILNDKFLFLGP